jgi:ribulose-phosphate 3-epimerase
MIQIVPAVLPKSYKDLEEHLTKIKGAVKLVQIDVVDGVFAHGKTWPYHDRSSFEKIISEEHGLPLWDEFDFEFDLMIENPAEHVMDYVRAAASRIIVHARAAGAVEALQKLADLKGDDYGAYSIKTGLALMCDMQPEVLESFDTLFDFVQVMGIAHVGHQGEPFDKRAIYLSERLRQRYPDLQIQVDGAVTMETAHLLAKAGASNLVVGHAIWDAADPVAEIAKLKAEADRK